MTCDHHDRTARRATLLVTTADKILGTHKPHVNFRWSTTRLHTGGLSWG
jgi:hypothetical protein